MVYGVSIEMSADREWPDEAAIEAADGARRTRANGAGSKFETADMLRAAVEASPVVAGEHEREVRVDQTRRIVEWLRSSDHAIEARDTALGLGIPPEDALADAIEREFGGGDDAS